MNKKYMLGSILIAPFLPLMYFQAKRIKSSVPRLREAKGLEGAVKYQPSSDTNMRVLSVGESTMAGVGVNTHAEGFTGTLTEQISKRFMTNVDWKVYARSGYTVQRVTDKIIPEIQESEVDLIIVGLGGNNAFQLNSPRRWRKEVLNLILGLRFKFPEAVITFTNMPPIKAFPAFTPIIKFAIGNLVEMYGDELCQIVKQFDQMFYNSEIITLEGWMTRYSIEGKVSDFFSDGVHPSKLTYQTWAMDLANFLWSNKEINATLKQRIE